MYSNILIFHYKLRTFQLLLLQHSSFNDQIKKVISIRLMSIVPSTTFLLKNPNHIKAMTVVFHITFLFQRSTNKFKAGQNTVVQWILVNCSYFLCHYQNLWQCLFNLLLVKILLWFHKIMPMETQSFGLRYIEIFLLYLKLTMSLGNSWTS